MSWKIGVADRYVPRWRRYAGAASGAVVGGIIGNVPGAVTGGYWGYKRGVASETSLPKNSKRMQAATRNYPTPSSGNRKRRLSTSGRNGSAPYKKRLFIGKSQRPAYNKAVSARSGNGRRRFKRRGRRGANKKVKVSSGPYTGGFAKGKKNGMTTETKFLAFGYHKTIEQYGTLADPDCTHITHSTGNVVETCRTIAAALIRKVMTKAGLKVTNAHVVVNATADSSTVENRVDSAIALKFVYTTKEQGTSLTVSHDYVTVGAESFGGIVDTFGLTMSNSMIENMRDSTLVHLPFRLAVYKADYNVASTHWRIGAELALEDVHIELGIQSVVTVQNRTKAALTTDGTDQTSVDRIDVQPLKGYIYDFAHGDPRVKHSGNAIASSGGFSNQVFNLIGEPGLNLIRGATFSPAQEPVVPKYFLNCTKNVQVVMQPGEMKKMSFVYAYKGNLGNYFKSHRPTKWITIGTDTFYTGLKGKAQMLSLEELMRTPSSNLVTLAYEREMKIGCIATEKRYQAPLETKLLSTQINNP